MAKGIEILKYKVLLLCKIEMKIENRLSMPHPISSKTRFSLSNWRGWSRQRRDRV